MPDKEGSEDNKSTKSVVNKKQKQMMGEEGYDIARDMGKVSPSKDKKDATTMPVSDEVKKTQKKSKGKSAVELVKASYGKSVMNVGKKKANEELDLSKVAEAFGGYIVEDIKSDSEKEKEALQKAKDKKMRELDAQERLSRRGTAGKGDMASRTGKIDARQGGKGATSYDTFDPTDEGEKPIPGRTPLGDTTKGGKVKVSKIGEKPPEGKVAKTKRLKAQAAKKQRISTALQGRDDMEGGERKNINPRKQGTPVKTETKPSKNAAADVDKDAPYQFNTFKDSEMKKRKTFKQAFGRPTGADPKTGKPTYRVSQTGPAGQKREVGPDGGKAFKRPKGSPDVDTVKTAIDMGVNPDEMDKNKFIDQKVRDARMTRLGTPDPFDSDYDKKVKKVDQRTKIAKGFKTPKFQTSQRPLEVDRETAPDAEKIASQIKKTKVGFQDFDKKMRDAKVDADIERTISGKKSKLSQTQVVGGGGSGGNKNKTRTGSGTPDDPEIVKNGRADNARNITNVKDPSAFSQARDKVRNFAKKDPVAALATYDIGKGILGKIMKARIPNVPTPRAIRVSAKS